jgi:protein-L-isoaspartate(D-aspartate) O-methyltransferase
MTSALELSPNDKVLEVGTGSGYQSAIIAQLVKTIISTEVIPELVEFSKNNIKKAGIENIRVFEEDGSKGMVDEAPFDKIIITAACREFPAPLLEQLKIGGIIIAPIGDKDAQEMVKGTKKPDGKLDLEFLGPFLFTPLYGKYGFEI